MPRYGRGLYPLKGCVQWYVRYWETRAMARGSGEQAKRTTELRDTLLEAKIRDATGQTVSRVDVVMAASNMFLQLGKFFDNLPAALQRDAALSPDAMRVLRTKIDQARINAVRDLREFMTQAEIEHATKASAPAEAPKEAKRARTRRR
jgi:hypothetical protein